MKGPPSSNPSGWFTKEKENNRNKHMLAFVKPCLFQDCLESSRCSCARGVVVCVICLRFAGRLTSACARARSPAASATATSSRVGGFSAAIASADGTLPPPPPPPSPPPSPDPPALTGRRFSSLTKREAPSGKATLIRSMNNSCSAVIERRHDI